MIQERTWVTGRLNTEKFIFKSREVHGEKYDYSLVDYKRSNKEVKIICKDHGVFNQKPSSHMQGNGCQKCSNNWSGEGCIYIMTNRKHTKIGVCKDHMFRNPESRAVFILHSQVTNAPDYDGGGMIQLGKIFTFGDGTIVDALKAESQAHKHFKAKKVETAPFSGGSEFFRISHDDAEVFLLSIGCKPYGERNPIWKERYY